MKVVRFNNGADESVWNEFVKLGKNKSFLFERSFMDYHSHRFLDYSLLIFDNRDTLVGVLPANQSSTDLGVIISHEGLTYGGLVFRKDVKLESVITIMHSVLKYLFVNGFRKLRIKQIPAFYSSHITNEFEYAMFLCDATLYRRDVAFAIDYNNRITYSGNIRRDANKAQKLGAVIKENDNLGTFWKNVLEPNLKERFGAKPVHSIDEISLLKMRFPNNIRQFNVLIDEKILAGTTLFIDNGVVHCQYISSTEDGRKTGALNYLFCQLIDNFFSDARYFDFGIVNEKNGRVVNKGMLFWKESFGGRAIKHDFYEIDTEVYHRLEIYFT